MRMRALSVVAISWLLVTACGDDAESASSPAAGSGSDAGSGGGEAGSGGGEAGSSGRAGSGGHAGNHEAGGSGEANGGPFKLTSSAVEDGQMLPAKYRCDGAIGGPTGPNPPLAWSGAPQETKSFAVLLRDRTFMDYQHWTLYDIPSSVTSLPEGVPTGVSPAMPDGAKQANNSPGLTGPGYYGPCGQSGMNHYEFVLYALDVDMLPMPGMTGASVEAVLEMHDLAKASLNVMSGPP